MKSRGHSPGRFKSARWLIAIGLVLTIGVPTAGTANAVAKGGSNPDEINDFNSPGRAHQPHFIWFWPRNAVDDAQLRLEVQQMAGAGAGGFQILAQGGESMPAAGQPQDAFDYGTPEWAAHIRTALEAAQANGMTADLQTSEGWPWTSPVTSDNLNYSTQQL